MWCEGKKGHFIEEVNVWKHIKITSQYGNQSNSIPARVTEITISDSNIGNNVAKPDYSYIDEEVKM